MIVAVAVAVTIVVVVVVVVVVASSRGLSRTWKKERHGDCCTSRQE